MLGKRTRNTVHPLSRSMKYARCLVSIHDIPFDVWVSVNMFAFKSKDKEEITLGYLTRQDCASFARTCKEFANGLRDYDNNYHHFRLYYGFDIAYDLVCSAVDILRSGYVYSFATNETSWSVIRFFIAPYLNSVHTLLLNDCGITNDDLLMMGQVHCLELQDNQDITDIRCLTSCVYLNLDGCSKLHIVTADHDRYSHIDTLNISNTNMFAVGVPAYKNLRNRRLTFMYVLPVRTQEIGMFNIYMKIRRENGKIVKIYDFHDYFGNDLNYLVTTPTREINAFERRSAIELKKFIHAHVGRRGYRNLEEE